MRKKVNVGGVLDALLSSSDWMIRRRDAIVFEESSMLSRTHSFDFCVPASCQVGKADGSEARSSLIPLGFWWKAPDRYSGIDFVDENEKSLPLQTSDFDGHLTFNVLLESARRILDIEKVKAIPSFLVFRIGSVAYGDPVLARDELSNTWEKAGPDTDLGVLWSNDEFRRLLMVSALASIISVRLHSRPEERRIVKLRYTEQVSRRYQRDQYQYVKTPQPSHRWSFGSTAKKFRTGARKFLQMLGISGTRFQLGNAFIRSHSYHVDVKAPPGVVIVNSTFKRSESSPKEITPIDSFIHIHESDLYEEAYATVWGTLYVVDEWLTGAVVCAFVSVMVLFGIYSNIDNIDPTASQNIIAVSLLVPSVAMTIIWRRVHWAVREPQKWLRGAFLSLGVLLFYLALRIAESDTSESFHRVGKFLGYPVAKIKESGDIASTTWAIGIWAVAVLVLLLTARFHPVVLWARWRGRNSR